MHIFNTLAPIILIIAAGWFLRRFGFMTAEQYRPIMKLVYWVGLPCLLFVKTAQATVKLGDAWLIFLVLLTGMVVCVVLAMAVCVISGFREGSRGAFVQGSYRGNLAYVGLPLVLFSLADVAPRDSAALGALAVVAIAPLIPLYNAVAVIFLVADGQRQEDKGGRLWRHLVFKILSNPLILACALGIGFAQTGWELPLFVARSCQTLGSMALPLALLGIGVSLTFSGVRSRAVPALTASLLKVGMAPLAGVAVAHALRLGAHQTQIALLFLACPTAVTSYVMAQQMGADDELAGSIVVTSTLLALPAIALILMFAG